MILILLKIYLKGNNPHMAALALFFHFKEA